MNDIATDPIELAHATALKLVELVVDPTKADCVAAPVTTAEERNAARRKFADHLVSCIDSLASQASALQDHMEILEVARSLSAKV